MTKEEAAVFHKELLDSCKFYYTCSDGCPLLDTTLNCVLTAFPRKAGLLTEFDRLYEFDKGIKVLEEIKKFIEASNIKNDGLESEFLDLF